MTEDLSGQGRRAPRSLGVQVFASESHAPRARRAVDDRSDLEDGWERLAVRYG